MKQIGNNEYIFKGWDWTEVAEYFVGKDCSDEDARIVINRVCALIHGDLYEDTTTVPTHPDVLKIREFVRKVSLNEKDFAYPLWKGLCEIQSDFVFLTYFSILYEHLWT